MVISTFDGKSCGLLVHRILDILDADLSDSTAGSREGIQACAVIDGRVHEIIDLAAVVKRAIPTFFDDDKGPGESR